MATIPFNPCDLSHLSFMTTSMKDLSLFLLKNSFSSRMKRGIRSFCHNVSSTSTLNQSEQSNNNNTDNNKKDKDGNATPKTLEEMLLQLDLEEAAARRAKLEEYGELNRRMSCVNNSDILRSARNAVMNQYPRFSLDGRDAMYRSSFRRNLEYELDVERSLRMPPTVAGECVVWCKPGVVAKLMGLDAVPVPVPVKGRRRSAVAKGDGKLVRRRRRSSVGSSSAAAVLGMVEEKENGRYCVMKPVKEMRRER